MGRNGIKSLSDLLSVIQFFKNFLRGQECHMFSFRTKAPFKMKSLRKIYNEVCLTEGRLTKLLVVKKYLDHNIRIKLKFHELYN